MLNSYREYIQVQLTEPLTAGISYDVGLYYALGELTCPIDRLGIHLSDTQVVKPASVRPLALIPQIELHYPVENTDWELLSTCYVAEGGEEWMTIGNFYPDSLVTYSEDCPLWGGTIMSYIFIDDVFVEEGFAQDTLCFTLGPDIILCESAQIVTPFSDGEFLWQDGSTAPVYTVTTAGTYAVTVSTGCGVGSDTIEVLEPEPAEAIFEFDIIGNTVVFSNQSSNALNALWDFGDGGISEAWEPEHVYADGGTFIVTLIIEGYCSIDTMTQEIHIAGTGIMDFTKSSFIKVYPNPNRGTFEIQGSYISGEEFLVFDVYGRSVPIERQGHVVHLCGEMPGIYYGILIRGTSRSSSKIVVQN
jgi:hypothetical protein